MVTRDVRVVLALGAWADGSSWARVITALKRDGVKVLAAPLPLSSLSDDVAALHRSLNRSDEPIVLVGHAYAGAVIAEARSERIKALVYISALAPDTGETVADVFYRLSGCPKLPLRRRSRSKRRRTIEPYWRPCSVRFPLACITIPVGRPLWKDISELVPHRRGRPNDHLRFAALLAERMKAKIKAHAVDHTPSITAPTVVVDIIRDAIRAVSLV